MGPDNDDHRELQRGTSAVVIARNIRNDIEAGRLVHGQQLPSTRAVADEWGTSVATAHRAMEMLAEEGIVTNKARSSRLVNYPESSLKDRQPSPRVLMIGGYAGSGKTELGRILARNTGWAMLDKDTTTRAVVETALEALGRSRHDRESELYVTTIRPAEYEALIASVTENVQCGNSCIVTAPFTREFRDKAWSDRLIASLSTLGAEVHFIWVRCDTDTMRTYLRHRGAARDTWKLSHWDEYLAKIDLDFKPVVDHLVVDNSAESRPLQQQATELVTKVSRP